MCNQAVWYGDGQQAVMPYGWDCNCRPGGKSWLSRQGRMQDFRLGVHKLRVGLSLPSLPFLLIPLPSLPCLPSFLSPSFLSTFFVNFHPIQLGGCGSAVSSPVGPPPGDPGRQMVSVAFWVESHRLITALFKRFSHNRITKFLQKSTFDTNLRKFWGHIIIIIIIIMETYKAPLTRAQRRRTVHA